MAPPDPYPYPPVVLSCQKGPWAQVMQPRRPGRPVASNERQRACARRSSTTDGRKAISAAWLGVAARSSPVPLTPSRVGERARGRPRHRVPPGAPSRSAGTPGAPHVVAPGRNGGPHAASAGAGASAGRPPRTTAVTVLRLRVQRIAVSRSRTRARASHRVEGQRPPQTPRDPRGIASG